MLLNCGAGEDSWESLGLQGDQTSRFERKSILNIYWKGWCWIWSSNTWPPDVKRCLRKDSDAGNDWREEKGTTEDKMVGWQHWLNGHKFEQALGDGEWQESLACCSLWGHKELDTTEWLNNKSIMIIVKVIGWNSLVYYFKSDTKDEFASERQ